MFLKKFVHTALAHVESTRQILHTDCFQKIDVYKRQDIENQKYNTKKVKRTKTAKGVKKSTQIKLTGLNIFSSAKLKTEAPNQTNLKAGKRAEAARQAEKDLQKQKEEQAAKVTADLAAQQMEEKVRSVGTISQDGLLYILKEEDNGWLYVESGHVRGFVKASEIYTADAAPELLDVYQTQARLKASKENKDYTGKMFIRDR